MWLGVAPLSSSGEAYLDGSPFDRNLLTILIVCGLLVLVRRRSLTATVLGPNLVVLVFFLYCGFSALWSDYPLVALKRWTKVVGNVVMALVVLTDRRPDAALRKFITGAAFWLIPTSILLIKYFPAFGRYYDRWTGAPFASGVTDNKNSLGVLCMVLGIGIVWCFLRELKTPERRLESVVATGSTLLMVLWLLYLADSATSLMCFCLGAAIVTVAVWRETATARAIQVSTGLIALVGGVVFLFRDAFEALVSILGRDPTLTGRTDLWKELLAMNTSPLVGVGFESFFLGPRLEVLWSRYWWRPNEAHNGYLEIYLTLGAIGLALLAAVTLVGYVNAARLYGRDRWAGSLRVAYIVIAVIYNMSESAFKVMNPVWIVFLLAVIAVPEVATAPGEGGLGAKVRPGRRRSIQAARRRAPTHANGASVRAAAIFAPGAGGQTRAEAPATASTPLRSTRHRQGGLSRVQAGARLREPREA